MLPHFVFAISAIILGIDVVPAQTHATSVRATISDEAPRVIELKFSLPVGFLPAGLHGLQSLLPGVSVKWKHFDGSTQKVESLAFLPVFPEHKIYGRILQLNLSTLPPISGLIFVQYDKEKGGLQIQTEGREQRAENRVESFSCRVANSVGQVSDWPEKVERYWVGRDFWANRLQDWRIANGRLECIAAGPNLELRTVHVITRKVMDKRGEIHLSVRMGTIEENNGCGWSGFLIGAGQGQLDYRAAALIHHLPGLGGGILCVLDMDGNLLFKDNSSEQYQQYVEYPDICPTEMDIQSISPRNTAEDIQLNLDIFPAKNKKVNLFLSAWDYKTGTYIGGVTLQGREESDVLGSLALVSSPVKGKGPRFWFRDLRITGEKIYPCPTRAFGPVAACLYTLSSGVLKLTAQFMPIGDTDPKTASFRYGTPSNKEGVPLISGPTAEIIIPGYTATFEIDNWDDTRDWVFEIFYGEFPPYCGRIRKEPRDSDELKIAAFTGMQVMGLAADKIPGWIGYREPVGLWTPENIWFPYNNICKHLLPQNPDILIFTGDQIYEFLPTGCDYTDQSPALDYLYKWYLWCWAFHELTRQTPTVCLVDDHDVYQGNIWGWSGRKMSGLGGALGGYRCTPNFVNMVQRTQCSHLPDPFDPTPVEQGITVYYTAFNYGGVSFAVLEDRKFKTPVSVMGAKADFEGWLPVGPPEPERARESGCKLLGERQLEFLKVWGEDWRGAKLKVCVSQTIFACTQTNTNGILVRDTDSGGWPKYERDQALDLLQKAHAFKISGDQHLAIAVRHGIEQYGDAIYEFCVPSVSNRYRRWFDPAVPGGNRKPGAPDYTGDFTDGFGNFITVLACANPRVNQKEVHDYNIKRYGMDGHNVTQRIYNSDGYGFVVANKKEQTIRIECWPWNVSAEKGIGQFPGWPITISVMALSRDE